MNQLAMETSTENCSVALQVGDQVLTRESVEARAHARLLLPWASELLAEAGIGYSALDSLAVSRGPGGFTSLRIGLGVIQGIALAHDLPVHPVSSLDALAINIAGSSPNRPLLALLDARMGEVYAAWYGADGKRIDEESLLAPDKLAARHGSSWLAAGPGARAYADILLRQGFELPDSDTSWPDARAVLHLADSTPAVAGFEIQPVYLRDQVTS